LCREQQCDAERRHRLDPQVTGAPDDQILFGFQVLIAGSVFHDGRGLHRGEPAITLDERIDHLLDLELVLVPVWNWNRGRRRRLSFEGEAARRFERRQQEHRCDRREPKCFSTPSWFSGPRWRHSAEPGSYP
jgi:hypothetical protein